MSEQSVRINQFEDLDDTKMSYWHDTDPLDGAWYIYFPGCGLGSLKNHTVVENADGTITVSPSIKTTGRESGKWIVRHGYLKNGIWEPCSDDKTEVSKP